MSSASRRRRQKRGAKPRASAPGRAIELAAEPSEVAAHDDMAWLAPLAQPWREVEQIRRSA